MRPKFTPIATPLVLALFVISCGQTGFDGKNRQKKPVQLTDTSGPTDGPAASQDSGSDGLDGSQNALDDQGKGQDNDSYQEPEPYDTEYDDEESDNTYESSTKISVGNGNHDHKSKISINKEIDVNKDINIDKNIDISNRIDINKDVDVKHKSAISKCLSKWQNAPFTEGSPYRTIAAAVSVGGDDVMINDTQVTNEPALVLIAAGVNVFGKPKYRLLNPNGWYCVVANVNVFTDLTIDLHREARLADSTVSVDVNSNTNDETAAVGVHVGSNIRVIRVN